jgi:hypothetical protein
MDQYFLSPHCGPSAFAWPTKLISSFYYNVYPKCMQAMHKVIGNKKFWEELSPTFLWYDMDPAENDSSNNSSLLQNVFTEFLPGNDRGIQFTEPLPSKNKGYTRTETQTDGRHLWHMPLRWVQVPWYKY